MNKENNKMKIIKIMNYNENIHYDYESIFRLPYTGNRNNCTLVHDSSIKSPEGLMYWRQANQLSNFRAHSEALPWYAVSALGGPSA